MGDADPFTWADFRRFLEREFDEHKQHDDKRFDELAHQMSGIQLAVERNSTWSKASAEAATMLKDDADRLRTSRLTKLSVIAAWVTPFVSLAGVVTAIALAVTK